MRAVLFFALAVPLLAAMACTAGSPSGTGTPAVTGTGSATPEPTGSQPPEGTGPTGKLLLTRTADLVVIDLPSRRETTIASASGADFLIDPAWSPDGTKVAYAYQVTLNPAQGNDFGSDLYVVGADGGEPQLLAKHDAPGTFYRFPSFSPDGRTIYFSRSHADQDQVQQFEIARIDAAGGPVSTVVSNGYGGQVSPDGKNLVYVDLEGGNQSLTLLDLAANKKTALLKPGSGLAFLYAPHVAPDGERVVFAASGDAGQVPVGRASPRDEGGGFDPVGLVSAARDLLAGTAAEADGPPWDVYLVPADGSGVVTRLTEVYDDQPYPTWSRDSRHILYIGITGLTYIDADRRDPPVKIADGLLHAQLDWRGG